jgi:TRAP-type C4-dicarboxylate transport system permease small subunit
MQGKQLNTLLTFKKATIYGISFGMILFLFSLFASGYNQGYFLSILGIGIMIACMVVFGFGMFLSLIEEYTAKSKGNVQSHSFKKNDICVYKEFNHYHHSSKRKLANAK